ncbi:MAG: hypothetical protein NVS9B9_08680 [Ktedonobacteraceae bacterium]
MNDQEPSNGNFATLVISNFQTLNDKIDKLEGKIDAKIAQALAAKFGTMIISALTSVVVGVIIYIVGHGVSK